MDPATTVDEVCRGELQLEQPRRGYRFNIDAVLLARFAGARTSGVPEHVVDLGAGCGVVGLLLARAWPACRLTLVEMQPPLAEACRRNAERNGMAGRTRVVEGDLRDTAGWAGDLGDASLAVCNPPFFPLGSGRVSERPEIAAARHEVHCTLDELVGACAAGIPSAGTLALIHDAARRDELLETLARAGFDACTLRPVHPYAERPATRVLVHAARAAGGARFLRELPPLVVNDEASRYSAEVRRWLGEPEPGPT